MKLLSAFVFFLAASMATSSAQYITSIAGNDSMGYYGDGGPASAASLFIPESICGDANGNIYIADGALTTVRFVRIRKISASTGIITTIAGSYSSPPTSDSADLIPASSARFNNIRGLCIDKKGDLLISDGATRVRKLTFSTGLVSTVAGRPGVSGFSGDSGPATAALLTYPFDIAVDRTNNIYISDANNFAVRKIDAITGIITTIAGTGVAGSGGDGGPATAAQLSQLGGICVDTAGNVYIGDRANYRVRKVTAGTGIITTVAGTGVMGYSGDGGPATAAKFAQPSFVTLDRQQNLYILDAGAIAGMYRIRKVDAVTGIVSTYAGNGTQLAAVPDTAGDGGPATAASIAGGRMCFDTCGTLYLSSLRCRIRAVVATLPFSHTPCGFVKTGISEQATTSTPGLTISPNPSTGAFTLTVTSAVHEPVSICITDITGRVVQHLTTRTNKESPLELRAPPGLYIATATSRTGGKSTAKLIIQ